MAPNNTHNTYLTPNAIVESILLDSGYQCEVQLQDTTYTTNANTPIYECPGLFKNIFSIVIKDRREDNGIFYHTLKFDYAKIALEKKEFQFSTLASLATKDDHEQVEFYKRYATKFANLETIESSNENIYILCMTKDIRDERFWTEYGDNEQGVSLGFRIEMKDKYVNSGFFDFRDVYYENGYDFGFINEIEYQLYKKTKHYLNIDGMSTMAKFYKRGQFKWENESRLCFELNKAMYNGNYIFPQLETEVEKGRNFIRMSFDNDYFKVTLSEIICGKKVPSQQIEELKELVKDYETEVYIWQRN